MASQMFLTILGLNYTQELSKQYPLVKEVMTKVLSKPKAKFTLSQAALKLAEKGVTDINYFTILTAIKEIVDEMNVEHNAININIEDITIFTDELPF